MADYKYKLSIIIPLYNAEGYIGACLDSILSSDLPQEVYEIIVVDDGSKDEGAGVVKNYLKEYCNISLLSQKNQGQSVARNHGIQQCLGEYIWCVDADDKVDKQLNQIISFLDTNPQLDVLAWKLKQVTEDGHFVKNECVQPSLPHEIMMSGREAIISGYNPSSVCALAIRKSMILDNALFFKEGITHQDVELTYRLFAVAENVYFTHWTPYLYILRPNSTSQSTSVEKKYKYLSDELLVIESFRNLANRSKADGELSKAIFNRSQNNLLGLVLSIYNHRREWRSNGISKRMISQLKSKKLIPLHGPFDSFKKTVSVFFLNIWSTFFVKYY